MSKDRIFDHHNQSFCITHRILRKQIEVAKSTWKDHGGGEGYGFVTSKVKKFICPDKNKLPAIPVNVAILDNHTTSHISRHVG